MSEATQKAIPTPEPSPDEIARKQCWSQAIGLCAELAGFNLDKQAHVDIGMDKARWSRIKAGTEGIKWQQLEDFMDRMGNDAPLLWMLYQRGYDLNTLKKRKTEYEKRIAEQEAEIERLKLKNEALAEAIRGGCVS